MKNKKTTKLLKAAKPYWMVAAIISLTAITGVILLARGMAAGPVLNTEPEAGTITAPAISVNDTTASAGKHLKFGSDVATPPTTPGTPTTPTCNAGGSATTPGAPLTGYRLTRCEDFNGTSIPSNWQVYGGGGEGTVVGRGRVPSQCTVGSGMLILTQLADGATCGMSSNAFAQKYGFWEVRMRSYATGTTGSKPHPVLILWPDTNVWADGELDYFEADIPGTTMGAYLHCVGNPSYSCFSFTKQVDYSQWHTYGFEWTSTGFKGYLDGQLLYTTGGNGSNPSVSSHQTIQLDNLSGKTPAMPGKMEVDWVHMYAK